MKILVAPDSFKGSLSSVQASKIMKNAIQDINKNYQVTMRPMADGGEGTLESFMSSTRGKLVSVSCKGALGRSLETSYAIVNSDTAIIEYASIAGLMQVPDDQLNPDLTTSYGLGEVILDAIDRGCSSFIIGIGGSATNDGGLGMLLALGMQAWDDLGNKVNPLGKGLHKVAQISLDEIDSRLKDVNIKIASDVENPLCGEKGASKVYGKQKGATEKQINLYDHSLAKFASLIEAESRKQFKDISGAGAAGGVGFALLSIGGHLQSGAKLLGEAIDIEEAIQQNDLIITGEGQSDEQTLYGKAPGYISELAKRYNKQTVLISGSLAGNLEVFRNRYAGCFSIINQPLTLEMSMKRADTLLYDQVKQVVQLIDRFFKP